LEVGAIIEPYAFGHKFATFGFGGIPHYLGHNCVSHCFNLNGIPDPTIVGLQNVYAAYKNAIKGSALGGPTLFSHIL
jgi:hypothetical protein